MNTFIQTRITAGILTVILMRKPTGITDCIIRLVSTQQAPLAVILTIMSVRMPAEILVSGAAALARLSCTFFLLSRGGTCLITGDANVALAATVAVR